MLMLLITLACGEKDADTSVLTEPSTEPAAEETGTPEETGETGESEDTGSTEETGETSDTAE